VAVKLTDATLMVTMRPTFVYLGVPPKLSPPGELVAGVHVPS
jgi:hypothetical protein